MSDYGESFVQQSRQFRYRRDYAQSSGRARSELGETSRRYRPSRSGRNSAFQEFRISSGSSEDEYPSPTNSLSHRRSNRPVRRSSFFTFTDQEVFYFMTIHLSPERARRILAEDPPPSEFYEMEPVVKAGYMYYYGLYKRYFPDVATFIKVFKREFYKHSCDGMTDEQALVKICQATLEEFQREKKVKDAQTLAQRRLLNDERATPDSRGSGPSYDDSDSLLEPAAKEPLKFRSRHSILRFATGGRLIVVNPHLPGYTIRIEDIKARVSDKLIRRNIEVMESFKGPLLFNETKTNTALLFIERQLQRIYNSDVYKGNPHSNDTNDCLLIWRLLEMVIKQQGRVTGPDLARLLFEDQALPRKPLQAQWSVNSEEDMTSSSEELRNDKFIRPAAVEEVTKFLLGGHVDEAINSAISHGLLFDALVLAQRLHKNEPLKLAAVEARLLSHRSPHHPFMTLISVAAAQPVPLLMHTEADDGQGWRAHIAIVLANLNSQVAIDSIFDLGKALAQKEFHSAADFCFLAANLLSGRNCFVAPNESETSHRQHIGLITASLPDDVLHSTKARFGWSILDFCATEIYEYALRLANGGQPTPLSESAEFQRYRLQYAQLLDEYGGFSPSVQSYCKNIAQSIWNYAAYMGPPFIHDLCSLADKLRFVSGVQMEAEMSWVDILRNCCLPEGTVLSANVSNNQHSYEQPSPQKPLLNSLQQISPIQKPITTPTSTAAQSQFVAYQSQPVTQRKPSLPPQQPTGPPQQRNSYRNRDSYSEDTPSRSTSISEHSVVSDAESEVPTEVFGSRRQSAERRLETPLAQQQPIQSSTPVPQPYASQQQTQRPHNPISQQTSNASERSVQPNAHQQHQIEQLRHQQQILEAQRQSQMDMQRKQAEYQRQEIQQRNSQPPQQQRPSQPLQQQRPSQPPPQKATPTSQTSTSQQKPITGSGSSGFLGGLKNKLVSMIPTGTEMILPDDSNPQIRWDPQQNCYVGDGVDKQEAPPPPPAMPSAQPAEMPTATPNAQNGTAAPPAATMTSAGSFRRRPDRYFNAMASATTSSAPTAMAPEIPIAPPTFGFMPMAVDTEDGDSPFSQPTEVNPTAANVPTQ